MRRIMAYLDQPRSKRLAGVVGVLSIAAVVLNAALVSCEGQRVASGTKRSSGGAVTKETGKGGTAPSTPLPPYVRSAGEPDLRVRIAGGVEAIGLSSGSTLSCASGDANPLLANAASGAPPLALQGQVRITLEHGSWVLSAGGSESGRLSASLPLVVWPTTEGAAMCLSVAGAGGVGVAAPAGGAAPCSYMGRLRLTARSDLSERAFDVIEFVPIEAYLPGVVGKELPSGWPLEAYRVQAVCARTYALQERQRAINAADRFDLESSDHDQVYNGTTTNGPAAEAVRSTRGQALFWNDQVLRAYFSSTCGGRTASARDTWPTGPGWEFNLAAPIQASTRDFACQGSPLFRWSVVRDRAELVKRMRAYGEKNNLLIRKIKDLGAVEVMTVNADQRPSRYKIFEPVSTSGKAGASGGGGGGGGEWYQLSAEELRLACNSDAPGCPAIERKTRVNSGDFEFKVAGSSVTITGRGFGHGVGMCQYCAKGFAERGEDWKTMVTRFYPGAKVTSAY